MPDEPTAILFSGGVDSTAVAALYLNAGRTIQLLTFDNGAQKWSHLAEEKATQIREIFPDRCFWLGLDCTYLFHEIAIRDLEADVREYGNLICVGCKLAMLAESIVYCRVHMLTELADGFKKSQNYYPEQTPEYMDATKAFAADFGIQYLHPIYEECSLEPEDIALRALIPAASMQPYCLFERNPVSDSGRVGGYVQSKLSYVRSYVEEALGRNA